jgi:hypothetical protein
LVIGLYKAFILHFDTVIYPLFVAVLLPFAFVTVKLTVYFPTLLYVCTGFLVGEFCVPSPKLQFHDAGVPELVSVNVTVNCALPVILLAVNAAAGGLGAVTVIEPVFLRVLLPAILDTFKFTVYLPTLLYT